MIRAGSFTLIALLCVASCGKDEPDQSKKPAAKPAVGAEPAPFAGSAVKAAAAPAPRDPRIAEIFAAGKDCTWNAQGLVLCEVGDEMRKLAFEQQGDDELAASCMGALKDPEPSTRGLAAVCMKGLSDATRIPHLGAGLDAFEAEKEPTIRVAVACAFASGNARESGVEARVIALVRKLAVEPDGDVPASCLLDSMFPQYLMQASKTPSRAAGDVALEMTGKSGRLQTRALEVVALLTDRKPEVCTALARVATAADGDMWPQAVDAMAKLGDGCAAELDPIIDIMAAAMAENRYNSWQYQATRSLLDRVPLSKAQVAKLMPASKKLAKQVKGVFADNAKELATRLRKYQPPAPR